MRARPRAKGGGPVGIITGASSGIGAALARELVERGYRVTLAARRVERLDNLAAELGPENALAIACDVTRDGDVEAVVGRTLGAFGRLDVVVANAGYGVRGRLAELTLSDYREQMETNFFGLLRTAWASLPALKETRGRLVLVGSVVGHVAMPASSAYSASKFAVHGLAEVLRSELWHDKVGVTLVSPGLVESEFGEVASRGAGGRTNRRNPSWLRMPTGRAAGIIAAAIDRGDDEVVVTTHAKLLIAANRLVPSAVRALKR
jgi:short-subunit dehydrogenase